MTSITCDRCKGRIPTPAMNNRVQLVKWGSEDASQDTPRRALSETFDLCDDCEHSVTLDFIAHARGGTR